MILQERCGKVTGSHRKAPEIAGSGSSIPTGNLLDFFPVDSDQFPVLSSRNRSEIIGKNPKIFRLEYCFHVPVTSGAFLPEPARIFRPGLFQCLFLQQKKIANIVVYCISRIKNSRLIYNVRCKSSETNVEIACDLTEHGRNSIVFLSDRAESSRLIMHFSYNNFALPRYHKF